MNNGFNLVRLQPKQLLKTGDTMTGNLIMTGGSKVIGNLIGNADTAAKLQTPRAINGTNFDGTNPITTAQWGQARNINIASSDGTGGGTTVSINGSTNYTLRLPATIKASLTGNADTAAKLKNARTFTIGSAKPKSFDGTQNITWTLQEIGLGNYLPLTGGTMTGAILPNRNGLALGSANNRWQGFFTDIGFTNGSIFGNAVDGTMSIETQNMKFFFQNNASSGVPCFRPNGNDVYLGHHAHRWHTLYTVPYTLATRGVNISQILANYDDWSIRNNSGNGVDFVNANSSFTPSKNNVLDLGNNQLSWKNIWHNGIRSTSAGFLISANDNGTTLAGRGGIWINANGLRPLNGDGTGTCGQNGFRWNAVWCVNANNTTSDITLKKNIKRIDISTTKNKDADDKKFYNFVKEDLSFYSWDWKDEKLNEDVPTNIGVMAQELEQSEVGKMIVIPPREEEVEKEVFDEDGNRTIEKETITTNYAINDRNMYMSLGIALKQTINEIENLKKEIEILKSK